MGLNASKVQSKARGPRQEPLEAGTYPVRVVGVVALGLQPQQAWKGEEKQPDHEIMVTYELLDEFVVDEEGNEDKTKPRWLSENFVLYSLDSDLAKSTKRYFALDPNNEFGGDWAKVVGTAGMLVVVQKTSKTKGHTYNAIAGLNSMRSKEAERAPELVNDAFTFDPDEPDMEVFWKLPQFIRNKLTEDNLDFEGSVLQQAIKENPQPEREDKEDKPAAKEKSVKPKPKPQVQEESDEEGGGEDW